jgi:hypothetical protein
MLVVEQGGDPCVGVGHDCGLADVDGPAMLALGDPVLGREPVLRPRRRLHLQEAGTLPAIKPVLLRALDSHGRTGGIRERPGRCGRRAQPREQQPTMQARGGVTVRIGRGRRVERSVRDSDAAMLAGVGESCADIEALRAQERPFGAVPSTRPPIGRSAISSTRPRRRVCGERWRACVPRRGAARVSPTRTSRWCWTPPRWWRCTR